MPELKIEKDVLAEIPVEEAEARPVKKFDIAAWSPRTELGKAVKAGEIKDIDQILQSGLRILEPEIVDALLPALQEEFILIGQARGKFGGGARRIFKQTQKKTPEGNKPSFACLAVVGDCAGHVGVGYGKGRDTRPAREKALKAARLGIFKVPRGCGSWECKCGGSHSIARAVSGRCGSVRITLYPAPKGKGLCADSEVQKLLRLAGISDIWSQAIGQTRKKLNMIRAAEAGLKSLC